MTKEERKQKALEIKGDRKIYFEREPDAPEEFGEMGIVVDIADLSDCYNDGGRWIIPDRTPDWLYDLADLYGFCELMESVFEFEDEETVEEFKEICDVII
jgi:hypothetical protein